jgi:hypothetical protein
MSPGRETPARPESDGDGRVEVAARDVTERVRARHHGQAERERDAHEGDPHFRESRRQHGAAASAEHEPERSEEFRQ